MEAITRKPVVFTTNHRINFSELDPYQHMRTAAYASYFIDHRMQGLREFIGWDLKTLAALPFMVFIRRLEIDFIRPVMGDLAITITSHVTEFSGADARVECAMTDDTGKVHSRCSMVVVCVDRSTNRATDWPASAIDLFHDVSRGNAAH